MRRLVLGVLVMGMAFGMALDEALRARPRPWVFVFAFGWGLLALLDVGDQLETDVLGEDEQL